MNTATTPLIDGRDKLYVYALKGGGADIGLIRADGITDPAFAALDDAALAVMIAQDLSEQYGCALDILPSARPFLAAATEARVEYHLAIAGAELDEYRARIAAA